VESAFLAWREEEKSSKPWVEMEVIYLSNNKNENSSLVFALWCCLVFERIVDIIGGCQQ